MIHPFCSGHHEYAHAVSLKVIHCLLYELFCMYRTIVISLIGCKYCTEDYIHRYEHIHFPFAGNTYVTWTYASVELSVPILAWYKGAQDILLLFCVCPIIYKTNVGCYLCGNFTYVFIILQPFPVILFSKYSLV